MRPFTRDEEFEMWKFLLKEIPSPLTGEIESDRIRPRGLNIWEKFKAEVSSIRTVTSLRKRFSMPSFPTPFEMDFPMPTGLFENADVQLDHYRRIREYKEKTEGGLHLYLTAKHHGSTKKRKAIDPIHAEEDQFYEEDNPFEESVSGKDCSCLLTQKIKSEPVASLSPVVATISEEQTVTDERELKRQRVSDLPENPNLNWNPMQDFFVSLKDAIVSSHSTMLSAVRELVSPKSELVSSPKMKKRRSHTATLPLLFHHLIQTPVNH